MELSDYVRVLRRRWVIILVVLVACLAGAAGATILQDKAYKASTQILVTLSAAGLAEDTGSATYYIPDRVQSFASLLGTPPVVHAAVLSAGLPPETAVTVTAAAPIDSATLNIDVTAASASAAYAVANAYVKALPDVLTELNQVTAPSELDFKTLQAAQLPTAAFRPDPLFNAAIGLAAGIILGLAAAVTREALDRRIRDSSGIEDATQQTLLGVVPRELGKEPLPAQSHPESARTEAYRTIRTNLLFAGTGGLVRSMAITSPSAGEGKSALAGNLAVVFARAGQRVAVVDADLRRPTLHKLFRCSPDVGLTSVLNGRSSLDDALHHAGDLITVLTSGPMTRNPSELLSSPLFGQIIEKLEGSHDIVIVDTAPTLPVADAALVTAICGGVVVVGRLRSTTVASLKRTLDTLVRARGNILGVVVSGADEDPDSGYGYSYAAAGSARRRERPKLRRGAGRGRR